MLAALLPLILGDFPGRVIASQDVAAVYEHSMVLSEDTEVPVSPEEALMLMEKNIAILEAAIKEAPYLEDIPDPQVDWILCVHPGRFVPSSMLERLSCLVRSNSIYVVSNMGDRNDGHYQKLVARYHKVRDFTMFRNLINPGFVTFYTFFGYFGIFPCADMLYRHPAVVMASRFQINTILFLTAWVNTLPLLSAAQFYIAWALGMGVNFLSANTHNSTLDMTVVFMPQTVQEHITTILKWIMVTFW
uniref:Uncharacterized protein n=1 Tax=Taeniopygia guttata TaxID=59729 RepID=A0A674GJG2_TAEGU